MSSTRPKSKALRTLRCFLLFASLTLVTATAMAEEFDMECFLNGDCRSGRSRKSGNPSTGGQVRINPSAVPTESGFGIEGILFKDQVDLALVQGLGRVGAAISPSNSEETFFGPPGFEDVQDYYFRNLEANKYPSQKYTLAAAASLIEKKGSSMQSYSLKLGALGKYNRYTKNVSPGAGISGLLGPVTFGGSYYKDETQLDTDLQEAERRSPIQYDVQTYTIGAYLTSVILDYSHLKIMRDQVEVSEVNLYTISLLLKNFIFTGSKRTEKSARGQYNPITQVLDSKEIKDSYFVGVQYLANRHLLAGVLYNYYLLNELSLTATLFF